MASSFLEFSVQLALILLSISFIITVVKVIKGPTLPDRVLALDMLVAAAIGFIAVMGIKTGYTLYLDIALALGLVGFLATIAFARFILARGQTEEGSDDEQPSIKADVTTKKEPRKQTAQKPKRKVASSARKSKTKAK